MVNSECFLKLFIFSLISQIHTEIDL